LPQPEAFPKKLLQGFGTGYSQGTYVIIMNCEMY
jgi:hypothetical protein